MQMNPPALYSRLLQLCKSELQDGEIPNIGPLWQELFYIAQNYPHLVKCFAPLLSQFSLEASEDTKIRGEFPQEASEFLDEASDNTKPVEKRVESVIPLVYLLQYFSNDSISEIFKATILIIHDFMKQKKDLPRELLKTFEKIDANAFDGFLLEDLFQIVKNNENTEYLASSMAVFANFAPGYDNVRDVNAMILNALSLKEPEQIAASYMLTVMSSVYAEDSTVSSKLFLKKLLHLLNSPNPVLKYYANKAARSLVDCGVIANKFSITLLIDNFQSLDAEMFFKLTERFLDDGESTPVEIVRPIFDFASNLLLHQTQSTYRAECISILSAVAMANSNYLQTIISELLDIIDQMITNGTDIEAAKAIIFMNVCKQDSIPEHYTDSQISRIKKLLTPRSSSIPNKLSLEVAETLVSDPRFTKEINNLLEEALKEPKGSEVIYICTLILANPSFLSDPVNSVRSLFQILKKETDSVYLNALLHTIKEIIEHRNIPIDLVTEISDSIISGSIQYFAGLDPSTCPDKDTLIFSFIATVITLNPPYSTTVIEKLISWIPDTRFTLVPSLLEPIKASLDLELVEKQHIQTLSKEIMNILDTTFIEEDIEVSALIEVLSLIVHKHKDVLDMSLAAEKLSNFIQFNLEGEAEGISSSPAFVAALILYFNILNEHTEIEVIDGIIASIVPMIPFAPGSGDVGELCRSLIILHQRVERLPKPLLLKSLVEIAIMKPIELENHDISEEAHSFVVSFIKESIKGNRQLERQITQRIMSKRPLLNRFQSLMKASRTK